MARTDLSTAIGQSLARDDAKRRPESPLAAGYRAGLAELDAWVERVDEQPHLLAALPAHERSAIVTRAANLTHGAETEANR